MVQFIHEWWPSVWLLRNSRPKKEKKKKKRNMIWLTFWLKILKVNILYAGSMLILVLKIEVAYRVMLNWRIRTLNIERMGGDWFKTFVCQKKVKVGSSKQVKVCNPLNAFTLLEHVINWAAKFPLLIWQLSKFIFQAKFWKLSLTI